MPGTQPAGRSGAPGKPGASLGGRRQPGAKPSFDVEEQGARRAGVRPGLEGRGAGGPAGAGRRGAAMGPAGSARRHGRDEDDTWTTDLIEDEELWAVDEPAPAVIETTTEDRSRKDPGPALGL